MTLAFQGVSWAVTGSWPPITLMTALGRLFGLDLLDIGSTLPLDLAAKATYVLMTTELSLFLWWTGTALFCLMFAFALFVRK
ncbi:MAG: potassium:proton antiporter [Pseudodesulfovibrio sp.]|nr:potassium:proton antiporter [Pseudodesulfovibrio indicus]TDT90005.1 hypothetical protein EDC59_103309 [Pseudodesulfovibrio indicus]